jgi:hypothetical protein
MKLTAFEIFLLCMLVFAVSVVPAAHAEIYTWTNDDGSIGFAEDLGAVPEKYRASVKKGGGENVSVGTATAAPEEKPQPRTIEAEPKKQKPFVTMEEEKRERDRKEEQRQKDEKEIKQVWENMKKALEGKR